MQKNLLAYLFMFCILFGCSNSDPSQFEGTVHIKETTYAKGKRTITYSKMMFLGSNVRFEEPFEESSGRLLPDVLIVKSNIFDQKILVISQKDKEYIELDFQTFNELKELNNLFGNNDNDEYTAKIERGSGSTTTLYGYKCQKYFYGDGITNAIADICENFPNSHKMLKKVYDTFNQDDYDDIADGLKKGFHTNGFPFKIVIANSSYAYEWEVVKVDKSKPIFSLFDVPQGYKKIDLMDMLKEQLDKELDEWLEDEFDEWSDDDEW